MQNHRRRFIAWSGLGALAAAAPTSQAVASVDSVVIGVPLPLTPQVTEGPFYLDVGLTRSDITEGIRGVPLDVRLRIVDARSTPLPGFRVDLWHCDTAGAYSGFEGPRADSGAPARGRTFLRGTVVSDRDGIATFHTVYPGWYEGRTTHIHLKVFNGGQRVLTSQLFLPDALSEYLYTNLPAYLRDALRDTLNRRDGIALEAGDGACGAVREASDRYVVEVTTVVDPHARPPAERPPGPPPNGARNGRGPAGGPPSAGGPRPSFQFGNQGGNVRGGIGLSGNLGREPSGDGALARPGDAAAPPFDGGPRRDVPQGEARVAAIVPGS